MAAPTARPRSSAAASAEAELGELAKGPRRVADLLDAWVEQLEARGLAASTVETYRLRVDKHLKPALGNIDLGKLSAYDLDRLEQLVREHESLVATAYSARWEAELQRSGLAPDTFVAVRSSPEWDGLVSVSQPVGREVPFSRYYGWGGYRRFRTRDYVCMFCSNEGNLLVRAELKSAQ